MKRSFTAPFLTRRDFLAAASGISVAGAITLGSSGSALADYPETPINVVVPTQAGGGAERNLKAITSVWSSLLGTPFEPSFYPGAAGRIGYEVYMQRFTPNAYHLLFGNMGPEVLNWSVQRPSFDIDDLVYFGRVDTDPAALFVAADSPYQTIDDVVAEAKRRTLAVATSRLAHPGSIGVLALGERTGGQFKLVPLSGAKNTLSAVIDGEMDVGVLTSGSVVSKGSKVRTVLIFDDTNRLGDRLDNAPTMNQQYGTDLPPMLSSRAFGIHRAAMERFPERFETLSRTFKQCFEGSAFQEAYVSTRGNWEYVNYGGLAECADFKAQMLELGQQFRSLLSSP